MKKLLILFFSVMASVAMFAQSVAVSGTVIDSDSKEPLIGVSILEVGTTNGMITDLDGNFQISVAAGTTLQLSYVGYETQEIKVGKMHNLGVIELQPEAVGLEDVTIAMHPGRNDDMVITIDGESAGVLIGHHGDTLDALQYLANLAANRKEEGEKREYARITVDVESYRAKREEALRILARKKAHQVLKYKKSIMLEPMNPYERRIIHSEIQKMEGVSTNSIGVENNRRIVIYLEEEGMPTAGIKAKGTSEKSSSKSRSKSRRRSGSKTVDPLSTEAITGEARKQGESIFGSEEHDPFDIDLSAATYSEENEVEETEIASDEE